jgi:Uma2 family endonuclease
MAAEPIRRLFTTDEYHVMLEAGILTEDDRVELIEGEILEMPPIGSSHAGGVNRLNALFTSLLGSRAVVSVQNPVVLDKYSEPQPDLVLLRFHDDYYASALPTPSDVLLLIEVSDSSLKFDRDVKAGLYARHGLLEVWLRDVEHSALLVHRTPSPEGYRDVRIFRRGEQVSPLAFPDLVIEVDALLGPAPDPEPRA